MRPLDKVLDITRAAIKCILKIIAIVASSLAALLLFAILAIKAKHFVCGILVCDITIERACKLSAANREFIVEAFKKIPDANAQEVAFCIDGSVMPEDVLLPLKKGFKVVAIDQTCDLLWMYIPAEYEYKYIASIDFNDKSPIKLLTASFTLPFYDNFNVVWPYLVNRLESGGYFIGNFFGTDFELFGAFGTDIKLQLHTLEEVKVLLHDFEILKLEEVKHPHISLRGQAHYYEVFARKK